MEVVDSTKRARIEELIKQEEELGAMDKRRFDRLVQGISEQSRTQEDIEREATIILRRVRDSLKDEQKIAQIDELLAKPEKIRAMR